jgi:hypothetical protein
MTLTAISHLKHVCQELYDSTQSYTAVAQILYEQYQDLPKPEWLRKLVKIEIENLNNDSGYIDEEELVDEASKLARKHQQQSDTNRIERRAWRTHTRAYTAIETLQTEILETLKTYGAELKLDFNGWESYDTDGAVAVLHLSDLHFNELIDLPYNKYDFKVAAKRLKLLVDKTKLYARAHNCERIVVVFGGDLINSDRRIDEVLSMATNRARAVVLAVHLLRQLIHDLHADFDVDTFGITGNEGRAKQELSWGDPAVTDSYDASIYWMLASMVHNPEEGIRCHKLRGNEALFKIHSEVFLVLHGHQLTAHDQKAIQAIIGKHSAIAGQQVTHILCGHIHSSLISDFVSRNSSLAGANAYSTEGLNFASKAAQNLHIVTKTGLDGIKLDLQDITGVIGYAIIQELEAHCARSVDKAPVAASETLTVTKLV